MRTGTAARRVTLGATAWLVTVAGAFAQTPVSDFTQVPTRLRLGDTVYVTDSAGRQHKGMIFDLSASQLVLESGGKRQDFQAGQVAAISWRAADPVGNGALIGMGIGAGWVVLAALTSCNSKDCAGWAALGMLAYGGLGAGIGAGIDALVPGKKFPIYKSATDRPSASLSLSPILSPRRKGLAATVRF